jgi:hypothetical protein
MLARATTCLLVLQTLFVNVCDRFLACTAVTKDNQAPLNITAEHLDKVADAALTEDASKLARSGNVEGFATLLTSMISYFPLPPQAGAFLRQISSLLPPVASPWCPTVVESRPRRLAHPDNFFPCQ